MIQTSITEETAKTFIGSHMRSSQRDTVRAELNMDEVPYNTALSPDPIH